MILILIFAEVLGLYGFVTKSRLLLLMADGHLAG